MFREQFKLVEITPFECVSSTQNSNCRKTMLNVEAAIERLVMSTNKCACSTSFLFVRFTHKSMCFSNKPSIGVEPTNRVCEYGPRSPTHFFVLDQLTLFNSVYGNSFVCVALSPYLSVLICKLDDLNQLLGVKLKGSVILY